MLGESKLAIRALQLGGCGVTLLFVGVVFGYLLKGYDWTYQADPMGENYVVLENTDDTVGELAAIQAAAATWNQEPVYFYFSYGGPVTNPAPVFDGINQISWGTTSGSLATTTWWWNTSTGDILEVDCVLNDNFTGSTAATTRAGQYDVESVMLHQFGHYLSLDHSTPPAIMQPTIPSGTQRRSLSVDDHYGIKAIYGGATGCSALGLSANVISPRPSQAIVNGVLLFSPLLLVLVVKASSNRKRMFPARLFNLFI